jgi:hypothetical protein
MDFVPIASCLAGIAGLANSSSSRAIPVTVHDPLLGEQSR